MCFCIKVEKFQNRARRSLIYIMISILFLSILASSLANQIYGQMSKGDQLSAQFYRDYIRSEWSFYKWCMKFLSSIGEDTSVCKWPPTDYRTNPEMVKECTSDSGVKADLKAGVYISKPCVATQCPPDHKKESNLCWPELPKCSGELQLTLNKKGIAVCVKDWNLEQKCLSEAQSEAVETSWKFGIGIKIPIGEGGVEIGPNFEYGKKYQTLEEYRKAVYMACMQHYSNWSGAQ